MCDHINYEVLYGGGILRILKCLDCGAKREAILEPGTGLRPIHSWVLLNDRGNEHEENR